MTPHLTGSRPVPRPVPFGASRSTGSRFPSLWEPEPVRPSPASDSPTTTQPNERTTMSNPTWSPEAGPKIAKAWHAIRDCLDLNGPVDHQTLVAVATSTGIVERTADNLLRELKNHGYLSRRKGIYELRPHEDEHQEPEPSEPNVPPVSGARLARYAEAMGVRSYHAAHPDARRDVDRVMAVADAELEQARAENERLRDLAQRNFKQGAALLGALTEAREQLSRLREAVERALDDEEANLADDGARLSHSVVRRLRAVLADVPPAVQGDTGDAPPAGQEAGEAQWWDADHNRPADAYTPPERTYCKRCGAGRLLHGEACVIKPSRGIRHPAPSGSDDTKGGGGRG